MATKLELLIALLHCLRYSTQACPNDNFTFCSLEGSTCNTTQDRVIAYGYGNTWAYAEKTGGVDLNCNDTTFGNPSTPEKQCCKLMSDLSGSSGLSPVVNIISCGETVRDFFQEGVAAIAHYWRFSLHSAAIVNISNCDTLYDTTMYIRNSSGQRLSKATTGCDGDDCGCSQFDGNEEIINLLLFPGDYYVEVKPYNSTLPGHAGVYNLSLNCEIAPTPAPTPSPKRYCDTSLNDEPVWCYDIELYPLVGTEISHTVGIANGNDYYTTYFKINITTHTNHCVHPSILFSFEEIDFSHDNEYIDLYYDNNSLVRSCTGTQDGQCGEWIDCFPTPQALGVDTIKKDEMYTITVKESTDVHNHHCLAYHNYSINAQLTIICSADSAVPTEIPTVDPTSLPTSNPTLDPSHDPTVDPTVPTGDPTTDPTSYDNESKRDDIVNTDYNDANDDISTKNDNDNGNIYFKITISCIILFGICCVLIICIYFQRKNSPTKANANESKKGAIPQEDVELGHVNPDMPSTQGVTEDKRVVNAAKNGRDSYLLVGSRPSSVLPSDAENVVYAPRASDNGLTPMGDIPTHDAENEPMVLPRLPSENMAGEDGLTDGDDDAEDLYIVPKDTRTQNNNDDDEGNDNAYNDIYGKGVQPRTAEGPGNDNNDLQEDDDEYNALYGAPNQPKTSREPGQK